MVQKMFIDASAIFLPAAEQAGLQVAFLLLQPLANFCTKPFKISFQVVL